MQKFVLSLAAASLAAAGLLLGTSGAQAQTTIGPIITTTPIPFSTTDFTGGLTFTKFDQSLGQLLSVQLNVSSDIITQLTVTNSAASNSFGTVSTRVVVFINDPGGVLPVPSLNTFGNPVPGSYTVTINSDEADYSLAPGATMTTGPLTGSGSKSATFTSAANSSLVSQFSGSAGSTIVLGAGTYTRTTIANNGGNTNASQTTQAAITGNVTYTYLAGPPTPPAVPEPGMMAFALSGGVGLAGMVVRGRRRAKNNIGA